ncbi:MAG: peptidylprolyl isomerase [Okeania sp. SIO3B5]|uniref:peptidylprolyl isomerase n=1 Tax=Okeania sp. SIO3B5 TaxID=2607811 RepID=UPI0013FEFC6E|nr:peptidylprolyl isomerase [Okeania sp. SIO3B5]NEO56758.1 peptidylprolyl isomerase [Okeania sp. SIO3B5]
MLNLHNSVINTCKRLLKTGILALLLFTLSVGLSAAWWDFGGGTTTRESRLPQGDPITDGQALLRYALPIDNEPVRKIQSSLEDIANRLRGKRWSSVSSDIAAASRVINISKSKLLASVSESKQSEAEAIIEQLNQGIINIREVAEAKDGEQVLKQRAELLALVGQLEELMLEGFPFEVSSEFANLPQLKGRATIEMETEKGSLTLVVDGYSAPITAGNFVDLVQRGFYDGLEFIRSEQSYVLQTGDPPGPEVGFIDPDSGEYRNIPLEILVKGDEEPIYSFTLEEIGRFREQPVLPFSAYGTVAMARPESENDGGSSQFFFFLFQPELTPAGVNLLDGRYTVFGYVVEGKKVLEKLAKGDKIISAKVVAGLENLVEPEA